MSNYTAAHKYTYLWNKYRPALLRFMIDSANESQEYKFSKHEFQNAHANEKGGHSFTLRAHRGKAINDVRTSDMAKDLLTILQRSEKAMQLMDESIYEFTMDKQFMLHITHEALPVEETEEEAEETEETEVIEEATSEAK